LPKDDERSKRRTRRIFTVIVLIAVTGTAGVLFWTLQPNSPRLISGQVKCLSGRPVAGIHIEVPVGDSGGFVTTLSRDPDDPSIARFTRRIRSKTYFVNVGCGIKPDEGWENDVKSDGVTDAHVNLICYDRDTDGDRFGRCATAKN
jgi:hypothetical protein